MSDVQKEEENVLQDYLVPSQQLQAQILFTESIPP